MPKQPKTTEILPKVCQKLATTLGREGGGLDAEEVRGPGLLPGARAERGVPPRGAAPRAELRLHGRGLHYAD